MSGLDHGWDKGEEKNHADFIHGAVDEEDFYMEVNYAPKRKKKGCKRSKTGEACNFNVPVITYHYYSKYDELYHYRKEITCERCGKHGWGVGGGWFYTLTPV